MSGTVSLRALRWDQFYLGCFLRDASSSIDVVAPCRVSETASSEDAGRDTGNHVRRRNEIISSREAPSFGTA